jgi:phosphatidate cytidylyltransferase
VSELAKRWAVAGVGIPVVIVLLRLGGWALAVPLAALAALGAREVYGLASKRGVEPLSTLGAGAAATFVLLAAWQPTFTTFAPFGLALVGGASGLALVVAMSTRATEARPLEVVAVTLFGALYTGLALAFVPLLHALPDAWSAHARSGPAAAGGWDGLLVVALPLAATWLGDACAFFAGSAWGRGGLAPSISPNKSWVGVWAGLAGAGLAGVIWYLIASRFVGGLPFGAEPLWGPVAALSVGVLVGGAAIVGDLVESLLKRAAGVKDSGRFFPGHGGVLDRLDALVFTLPMAYVALVGAASLVGAPMPAGMS